MESMKTCKTFFVLFLFTFLSSFPLVPTQAQSPVRNTRNPEITSRRDQVNPPLGEYVGDPEQQSQQGRLNQQPLEGSTQPYASNNQPISDPSQPFNNQPISGTGQPFSATTSGTGLPFNNRPIPGTGQPFTNNQPISGTGQPLTNLPFLKNTRGNNIPFLNEASQEKKLTLLVVLVSLFASMAVLG